MYKTFALLGLNKLLKTEPLLSSRVTFAKKMFVHER